MQATIASATRQTNLRTYAILILAIVAFGFSAIFARIADAPGMVVATWRVSIAAAVLAIPFARQTAAQRRLDRHTRRWALIGGTIFAASVALFHVALDYTTAANATFLGNIAPLWVGLITLVVLRRALPRLFWPGVAVALTGAALIVFGNGGLTGISPGDLIVLFSSMIWAAYQVITGEAREQMSTLTWVWLVVAVACVWLVPLSLLLGEALGGYNLKTTLAMLGAGLVSQVGGFLGFNYALGHIPAPQVSVANMLQPVITAVAAFILLGEPFGGLRLVGGGLILAGIYLVNHSRHAGAEA